MSANTERPTLYEFMPYGAPELMEVAKPYMLRAIMGAIVVMMSAFGLFALVTYIQSRQLENIPVVQMQVSDLAAPPPLTQDTPPPQVQVEPSAAPPVAAIPVPVPDAEAPPEQTIMTQEEISTSTPGISTEGDGRAIVVAPPAEESMPGLGEYVYVEELPEAIKRVAPRYPDLAREAGVDGTVLVQALVDKGGKVRDVRVQKSIPMLDQAAVDAVKQWTFKPALSNNKPVAVWVAVPVKFSLN